ncbi:hypothetical protein IQ264_07275 [Phormidium sp. LEGE 05292]|uniref:hypothetical protein n=1 Tax=[Phormidium] sp. LEGE 05292 TaxID=767427 RepID=UPI001880C59C|nr:hypothetical protein [Phormidium sp. LEGE 05292]MBE9225232.1 hypothetical protein [Phormidium sp. LEGE 05292]
MKKSMFMLATLSMIALVSCSQKPSQEAAKDKTDLCKSVATLQQDLAKLNTLTPNSTVGEVQAVEDRIQFALDRLTSAAIVEQAELRNELKQAQDNLVKTIKNLPAKETLGQAAAQIQQAAAKVETARAKLASGVQCP